MTVTKRTSRFTRTAGQRMVFQTGDLEILTHVHRFRILQTPHVVALTGRGEKAIQRRLRRLYDVRFLDRIRPLTINNPIIHALGNRGADEISKHFGLRRNRVDWHAKNRSIQRGYIAHTLMIGEVMSWITGQCRLLSDIRVRNMKKEDTGTEIHIKATIPFRGSWYNLRVTPDWVFSITGGDERKSSDKFFYLECDRSTMPVSASSLKRSSIEKKMSIYLASIRNGYHKNTFGQYNARVLWLVDSRYSGEKRLESLLEMNRKLTRGRGSRAFLFALREPLMNSSDIRSAPVVNGKGESVCLID